MPSRITNSSKAGVIRDKMLIGEGGHGKTTALAGLLALGGFPYPDRGKPLNTIPLDASGKIPVTYFGDLKIVEVGIDGPTTLETGGYGVYHLTTFDSFADYTLEASEGAEVGIIGTTVFFRAPIEPGVAWFKVDIRKFEINVVGIGFNQPVITSPENGHQGTFTSITVSCSDAVIVNNTGTEVFQSADWELSEDPEFKTTVRRAYRSTQKRNWALTGLSLDKTYYVRCRHNGVRRHSVWSEAVMFKTTQLKSINKPSIIVPAHQSFGIDRNITLIASAYQTMGDPEAHVSSDWLISTTENFSNVVKITSLDQANKTAWPVTSLNAITLYYAKVRYRSATLVSEWSDTISFITKSV